jgi:hypothetical protein
MSLYDSFKNLLRWGDDAEDYELFLEVDKFRSENLMGHFPKGYLPAVGMWGPLHYICFPGRRYHDEFICIYNRLNACQA